MAAILRAKVSRAISGFIPLSSKATYEGLSYDETPGALAKLPHRLGELARAASRLGEAEINIHYAYCGVDPNTNVPLLVFGVSDVGLAAPIVDRTIAAA